jgi:hypothetical protein
VNRFGEGCFDFTAILANFQADCQRPGTFNKGARPTLALFFAYPADFIRSQRVGSPAVIF